MVFAFMLNPPLDSFLLAASCDQRSLSRSATFDVGLGVMAATQPTHGQLSRVVVVMRETVDRPARLAGLPD
jgi:hypothetical protein